MSIFDIFRKKQKTPASTNAAAPETTSAGEKSGDITLNETEQYILNSIKTWVWSGFYSPSEVQEMIGDILEDDVDEDEIRNAVAPEFDEKSKAEATWPQMTDCDRLDKAFADLNDNGIVSLQNAGHTQSDGISDIAEELECRDRSKIKGYCFYHGQDLERAVAGNGLWLAFGDLDDTPEGKQAVGKLILETLAKAGLNADWDGDTKKRISVPKLDWKRRYDEFKLSSESSDNLPLPPESSFAETFRNLNPDSNSFYILANGDDYMQCGGSHESCTVELRKYAPGGAFRHYVFYHASGSDEPAHIPMSGGGVSRQKKHCLTSAEAVQLFECHHARRPWPDGFALEDITDTFT